MPMIRLDHVSKQYGSSPPTLDDVSLTVEPGEFVSVIGQSGAGKSTLLRLLTAEEAPSRGRLWVGERELTRLPTREIPRLRRELGMVFQDYKLLPRKTVAENVAFALEVVGAATRHIRETVPQILKLVGLDEKAGRFPEQLSGGERQRVAVARALAHRPKLLLADEPTGNLDARHTQDVLDLLLRIHRLGTTIILVTHNRDVVNALRQRVLALHEGRLVQDQANGRYRISL